MIAVLDVRKLANIASIIAILSAMIAPHLSGMSSRKSRTMPRNATFRKRLSNPLAGIRKRRARLHPALEPLEHRMVLSVSITPLGSLPGSAAAMPNAINDLGQIVGGALFGSNSHAFLYDNGTLTDLGMFGNASAVASDINDIGDIVGNTTSDAGGRRGFLYKDGALTSIGNSATVAFGVNSTDDVVGEYQPGSETLGTGMHAFLFTGGVLTDIGTLGGTTSWANRINDSGQIAGTSYLANNSFHPFLYDKSTGVMSDLGTLGGDFSEAAGINASGEVIGSSGLLPGNVNTGLHAFIDIGGTMTDIGTQGGTGQALAVNDSGVVVGMSQIAAGDPRAFLYQTGVMTDLNTLLPANSGWVLQYATGINNHDQIIGFGTYNGTTEGFLLSFSPVPPTATPQTVTLGAGGRATITLTGQDTLTPPSELVFTLTSLPATGTLYLPNGSPAAVGQTFTGSAAVLNYVPPTEVLGALSASFDFTVTNADNPPSTSAPAQITIQTPADSTGVLRIYGQPGDNAFALSRSNGNTKLHVAVNGTSAGGDIPFSSIASIEIFGSNGTNTYSIAAGLPVSISVTGGTGRDSLTTGADNLVFDGGGGADSATVNFDSNAGTANLAPGAAAMTDGAYKLNLNDIQHITVNGNARSSATLSDRSGGNTFTATPTSATFSGAGLFEQANKFGTVHANAASGTTDVATLYDVSGRNTFYATPTASSFAGAGFYVKAAGFTSVTAVAAPGTSDTAYLSDVTGSNTFVASPTSAAFTGAGLSEIAIGFTTVRATAAKGTTDSAFLSDASGKNSFVATPSSATFSGANFLEQVSGFAKVYARAAAGTTDSAKLSDVSGSNTLYETPTRTSFSGARFFIRADGFASVTAIAAKGTTDTAYLSDSASRHGTFTASPTTASMKGASFNNVAKGFVNVSATAASSRDVANLSDSASGAQFTGSGKLGTLAGPNYKITVKQYGTVNITGATNAKNKIHVSAIDYVLHKFGTWIAD